MRVGLLVACLLLWGFTAIAQQASSATPSTASPAQSGAELHENVLTLMKLMGLRQRMLDSQDKTLDHAKASMMQAHPEYNPAFAEEFVKRMRAKTNVDDYVNVFVRVYEKYLNTSDVAELIQAQQEINASKTPSFSAPLKEKLSSVAIKMQSEILGGCAQVGAALGGEVGQEIEKEHPDWVARPGPGPKDGLSKP